MDATPQQVRAIAIGGGVLTIIGSVLPWAKVQTLFGSVSVSGFDGSDGKATAAFGALITLCVVAGGRWLYLALVSAVLAGLIAVTDLVDVQKIVTDVNGGDGAAIATVGIGLWVILIGVVVALVTAGILTQWSIEDRRRSRAAELNRPDPPPAGAWPPPA